MSIPEDRLPVPPGSAQWEHIPREERERVLRAEEPGLVDAATIDDETSQEAGSKNTNYRLPLILFIATCLSTVYVMAKAHALEAGKGASIFSAPAIIEGLTYSAGILTILLFHEFGHYLQARRYRVPASLPYFIPMPFSPLGTMGAVIGMSRRIPHRKALFDIGISGPLAGLLPALLIAWFGIEWSTVRPLRLPQETGPIFGVPPVIRWMMDYHHGSLPIGFVLDTHPLAMAGWTGIFVTALNLIPIGQLDGGHILYALLRKLSYPITTLLLYGALAFMLLSGNYTWLLLIMMLLIFGPTHPPTHDDSKPLGWPRILLGWATLSFILIGFTPYPIVFLP